VDCSCGVEDDRGGGVIGTDKFGVGITDDARPGWYAAS
jgi:hypothetical protein